MMSHRGPMLLCLPLCLLAAPPVRAQTPPASPPTQFTLGKFTMEAAHFTYIGNDLHLFGGATVTSPDYDVQATDVHILTAVDAAGAESVSEITADGDPALGRRVVGILKQLTLKRTYTMQADHAVYTPDDTRPDGGRIVFTGSPVMTVLAPRMLAGPSVTTADSLTVTLGEGPDYPQIAGDNGHMTLTPLPSKPHDANPQRAQPAKVL